MPKFHVTEKHGTFAALIAATAATIGALLGFWEIYSQHPAIAAQNEKELASLNAYIGGGLEVRVTRPEEVFALRSPDGRSVSGICQSSDEALQLRLPMRAILTIESQSSLPVEAVAETLKIHEVDRAQPRVALTDAASPSFAPLAIAGGASIDLPKEAFIDGINGSIVPPGGSATIVVLGTVGVQFPCSDPDRAQPREYVFQIDAKLEPKVMLTERAGTTRRVFVQSCVIDLSGRSEGSECVVEALGEVSKLR